MAVPNDEEAQPLPPLVVASNDEPSDEPSSNRGSSTPSQQLDSIPVEMQCRILSYLPAKQIQLVRRVSRHFRDTIDAKDHHSMLLSRGIKESLAEFTGFIKRYCDFPMQSEDGGPDALLDAVFDFISVRKLDRMGWHCSQFDMFSDFWIERQARLYGTPSFGYGPIEFTNELSNLWARIVLFHHVNIVPPKTSFEVIYEGQIDAMTARLEAFAYGGDGSGRQFADFPDAGILTQKTNFSRVVTGIRDLEMTLLHRALKVPVLLGVSPYSYYSASGWVTERLKMAMSSGEEISGVERAALMEDMYIA